MIKGIVRVVLFLLFYAVVSASAKESKNCNSSECSDVSGPQVTVCGNHYACFCFLDNGNHTWTAEEDQSKCVQDPKCKWMSVIWVHDACSVAYHRSDAAMPQCGSMSCSGPLTCNLLDKKVGFELRNLSCCTVSAFADCACK